MSGSSSSTNQTSAASTASQFTCTWWKVRNRSVFLKETAKLKYVLFFNFMKNNSIPSIFPRIVCYLKIFAYIYPTYLTYLVLGTISAWLKLFEIRCLYQYLWLYFIIDLIKLHLDISRKTTLSLKSIGFLLGGNQQYPRKQLSCYRKTMTCLSCDDPLINTCVIKTVLLFKLVNVPTIQKQQENILI